VTKEAVKQHMREFCLYCGGSLYWDAEDEEWRCYLCNRRQTPPKENTSDTRTPTPSPITSTPIYKKEKPLAPAEARKQRAFRDSPLSSLYSNGAWYPPHQITFRPEHMIFLIKHLPLLQEGRYPPDPIGTGYVDAPIVRRGTKHKSYFEAPAQLAAELEARLEQCGQDGLILEAVVCWGKTTEYLMRAFNCDERKLAKRINSALAYISGWKRKQSSYKNFVQHKGNRQK